MPVRAGPGRLKPAAVWCLSLLKIARNAVSAELDSIKVQKQQLEERIRLVSKLPNTDFFYTPLIASTDKRFLTTKLCAM